MTALREFPRAETVLLEASRLFPTNRKLSFLYIGVLLQQEKYPEAMRETERLMITFGIDDGILAAALQIREKVGPKVLDEEHRKGSLSVCMIVKNEEEQIARCLASLKPVAGEIIIADTGSTDRTIDICRAFGAQVHDFTWTNDFSEARNFSMSKATGQWVLIHDADEVISPRDYGKLRAILIRTPRNPSPTRSSRGITLPTPYTRDGQPTRGTIPGKRQERAGSRVRRSGSLSTTKGSGSRIPSMNCSNLP